MNEQMQTQFQSFLGKCQELVSKRRQMTLSTEEGKRYIRIVESQGSHRSVFAFVDKTTGDVLKAASFKAPAKHARGNIGDATNGMGQMTEYGPAYLR